MNVYWNRLRFQIWNARGRIKNKYPWLFRTKMDVAEIDEYISSPEEKEALDQEFEQDYQEYLNAEPILDPRRTMLFQTKGDENRCNFRNTLSFRKKIRYAYRWGQDHGINCFLVDTVSPFGLLAFETLLELRAEGEEFHLYVFQSKTFTHRKSYRLIPETEIEYLFLLREADYHYMRTVFSSNEVRSKAGTQCSENGIWGVRKRLPQYVLKAWGVV